MKTTDAGGPLSTFGRPSTLAVIATAGLIALSVLAAVAGRWKVLAISWVAFGSMAGGTWLGSRSETTDPYRLVWGYGVASGAMVTSAALFLVPQAIVVGTAAGVAKVGGVGIATGLLAGYSAHTVGHRLSHVDVPLDVTAAQITAHALSAGFVIGLVYGTMPSLGLLLGVAIVSHKGPAGYAAAGRLRRAGKPASALLLPAAGIGLAAIPAALLPTPTAPAVSALVFGFAAGIFLHVAMDFLPNCEAGSEIDQVCSLHEGSHHLLDELRTHAVGSTIVGAVAVVIVWLAVA